MPASENMVRFGLRNVHYATFSDGEYAAPVPIKGAVQLTTSPEGDSYTFYADDVAYYATETNGGYTGTIEVAAVNEQFLKDVLGYKTDETSGLTYESTTTVVPSVALLFEVSGNVEQQAGVFYNVTFSRIETEANTRAESTEPDTVTLNFTAIGRDFTVGSATENVVKAQCSNAEDTTQAYANFFKKVVTPGTAPQTE